MSENEADAAIPRKHGYSQAPPAITLYPENLYKESDDADGTSSTSHSVSFVLRVNPEDADGETYKKYVSPFENGTAEELLITIQDLEEIWRQMALAEAGAKWGILKTVFRGQALSTLTGSLNGQNPTNNRINTALRELKDEIFPNQALKVQKLWMRRNMKKPFKMSVRKYYSHVEQINGYLPSFPGGTADSVFSEPEIRELIEYSLPQSWQNEFDKQAFVPTNDDVTRAVLLARAEAVERHDPSSRSKNRKKKSTKKKSSKKSKKTSSTDNTKTTKWCDFCEKPTHNTADCYSLKKLKSECQKDFRGSKKNNGSNKTRNELNVMFNNMSENDLKKTHAALKQAQRKKRSSSNNEVAVAETETIFDDVEPPKKKVRVDKELVKSLENLGNSHSEESSDSGESEESDSVTSE